MNKPFFPSTPHTPLAPAADADRGGTRDRADRPATAATSGARRRGLRMLTRAEETRLARAWRDHGDIEARNRLITAFTPLVMAMVQRFTRGRAQDDPDMLQHAFLGLMRAADGFDPDRGVRFSTYAAWWVRAELQDYRMANWSLVRRGRSARARKAFFRLGPIEAALPASPEQSGEERERAIAHRLGVAPEDLDAMRQQFGAADSSLNRLTGQDGDGSQALDLLPDPDCDVEAEVAERHDRAVIRAALARHLIRLPERERAIVVANVIQDPPQTLQDLGDTYGISRERVRQLRERGLERLRDSLGREEAALVGR
ncbi:MAG: RNA polymerase factor sigma-32 [Roseovarius sp.]